MYDIDFDPEFDEFLEDLSEKDSDTHDKIINKIIDIAENLEWSSKHFKNLRYPLNKFRRAHLNEHFVLVFMVNKHEHVVEFLSYEHHDKVYKNIKLINYKI